jgi:hypothetical protein
MLPRGVDMRDNFLVLLFTALSSISIDAQQSIVVRGGGTALQQAVDAATPGDRLDVHAGVYLPVRISKGISIECRPGVIVRGSNATALIVDRVPAAEALSIVGGVFEGGGLLAGPPILIEGCAGVVVVDGIGLRAPSPVRNSLSVTSNTGPILFRRVDVGTDDYFLTAASVSNCAQVSFSHCPNLPPLRLSSSRVAVEGCVIVGRNASIGMWIGSGDVSVAGGLVMGSFEFSAANPLPAIQIDAGRLSLAGMGSIVAGRFGALYASAIELLGGELRLAPTVAVVSSHRNPIHIRGGQLVTAALPAASVDGVAPGAILTIDLLAEAASLTAVFVDLPRAPISMSFGDLWVSVESPVLDLRVTPGSGSYAVSGPLPHSLPLGLPVCMQPVSLTMSGLLWVGPAARTTLR